VIVGAGEELNIFLSLNIVPKEDAVAGVIVFLPSKAAGESSGVLSVIFLLKR
jgi:hypothetical protein